MVAIVPVTHYLVIGSGYATFARYSLRHTTLAHTIRAHDQSARVVYDWQDEFYLPLTGFAAVERPGPDFEIYVKDEGAKAEPD